MMISSLKSHVKKKVVQEKDLVANVMTTEGLQSVCDTMSNETYPRPPKC